MRSADVARRRGISTALRLVLRNAPRDVWSRTRISAGHAGWRQNHSRSMGPPGCTADATERSDFAAFRAGIRTRFRKRISGNRHLPQQSLWWRHLQTPHPFGKWPGAIPVHGISNAPVDQPATDVHAADHQLRRARLACTVPMRTSSFPASNFISRPERDPPELFSQIPPGWAGAQRRSIPSARTPVLDQRIACDQRHSVAPQTEGAVSGNNR